jgi:hypothetical protein
MNTDKPTVDAALETLILDGDADRILPADATSRRQAKMIKNAKSTVDPFQLDFLGQSARTRSRDPTLAWRNRRETFEPPVGVTTHWSRRTIVERRTRELLLVRAMLL